VVIGIELQVRIVVLGRRFSDEEINQLVRVALDKLDIDAVVKRAEVLRVGKEPIVPRDSDQAVIVLDSIARIRGIKADIVDAGRDSLAKKLEADHSRGSISRETFNLTD